jgi:hypothetical protein
VTSDGGIGRTPGAWLLHPIALVAVALLIVNDRVLKGAFDSWWTGKLSDFAGMIVFPLFCCAVYDWIRSISGAAPRHLGRVALGTCIATGLVFSAINVSPVVSELYTDVLKAIWGAVPSGLPRIVPSHTLDPTDLVALPALILAWWLVVRSDGANELAGAARLGRSGPSPHAISRAHQHHARTLLTFGAPLSGRSKEAP